MWSMTDMLALSSPYWLTARVGVLKRHTRCVSTSFALCKARSHTHYYDVLQITPHATNAQVKAAFYELSKKYHPDSSADNIDTEKFHEIVEAYEVLGSQSTRRKYDHGLLKPTDIEDIVAHDVFGLRNYKKKSNLTTGKTKVYDFDEYYKQHYGEQVLKRFQRKQRMSQSSQRSQSSDSSSVKQLPGQTADYSLRTERRAFNADHIIFYMILVVIYLIFVSVKYLGKQLETTSTGLGDKKNSDR